MYILSLHQTLIVETSVSTRCGANFLHSIIKISQFLPNQADIQAILPTHELIIFTKFHTD